MFVNLWKTAPFLRLLLPLIAGVITGLYLPVFPWWLMILFCLGWWLPSAWSITWRFRLRYARGACIAGAIFCLGMSLAFQHDVRHKTSWFGYMLTDTATLVVVLDEEPVKKSNSWKAEAAVTHVATQKAMGKIILYFSTQPQLHYNSRCLVRAPVRPIRGTGNPGSFDYAKYCSYRNIYHQTFLKPANWQPLPEATPRRVGKWLEAARQYCLQTLKTYIPGREEYGVAQALLIGYRGELDKDIVQAYTNTGVVHIIAISGLHLGLIYITLLQLLRWLPARKGADLARALILIAVLWVFSLLTGASASVLRSAVMFSTIAVARFMIGRHASIFNTLAAAAFLLLCYNPCFLVDAGFQLSFLAVAGILLCYQPLYDAWMVRSKWLDKIWQMIAVSLAAQVFTWPVCLYFFGQFPNYFLPANLVAVPLSTLLLYGEILLAALPVAGHLLGPALQWGIRIMNLAVQWIDQLPGAVTQNIYMDFPQMLCAYVFTIACCAWWLQQRKRACWWALGALMAFGVLRSAHCFATFRQSRLIVYNAPRQTLVEYIQGRKGLITGDMLAGHERYTSPAHLRFGVTHTALLPGRSGLLYCHGKRILLWKGRLPADAPARKIKVDYIILSKGAPLDIQRFDDFFIYEKIIFDASCPAFLLRKWKNAGNELPLRCFSVPDKGAFVVNL